jgi:hypothetical protein
MKKLLLISLLLVSCVPKQYKYKITGKVYVPTSGINPMHDAVWYTDSLNFDGDTLFYYNTDRSEVRITPPFTIFTLDK